MFLVYFKDKRQWVSNKPAASCAYNRSERVLNALEFRELEHDTLTYPVIINDSAAIVYQVGHMTADKGLKLYCDTMRYSSRNFRLSDSVRGRLLAH